MDSNPVSVCIGSGHPTTHKTPQMTVHALILVNAALDGSKFSVSAAV